jgi:hypothetical protein
MEPKWGPNLKTAVLWYVTLCISVNVSHPLPGFYFFHLQDRKWNFGFLWKLLPSSQIMRRNPRMTWRMASSGLLRRVALIRTDVSKEVIASIIVVTRIGEIGTLSVTSNQLYGDDRFLRNVGPHTDCTKLYPRGWHHSCEVYSLRTSSSQRFLRCPPVTILSANIALTQCSVATSAILLLQVNSDIFTNVHICIFSCWISECMRTILNEYYQLRNTKTNSVAFNSKAKYTHRTAATCRRS